MLTVAGKKTWVGEHVNIDECLLGMRDSSRKVMTTAEGKMIVEIYPFCLWEYKRQCIRKYQVDGRREWVVVQIRAADVQMR